MVFRLSDSSYVPVYARLLSEMECRRRKWANLTVAHKQDRRKNGDFFSSGIWNSLVKTKILLNMLKASALDGCPLCIFIYLKFRFSAVFVYL